MTHIGIDYSATSPGMCLERKGKYMFYFYAQRVREKNFGKEGNIWRVVSLPYPDWITREERYDKVAEGLMKAIRIIKASDDCKVAIEGYSYGSQGRGVSVAYEAGAIIRHKLYQEGIPYEEYSPSSIKKHYALKGNVNKYSMYQQFKQTSGIDLEEILGLKVKNDNVPSPIQDLIDAYAIVQKMMGTKSQPINLVSNILKKMKT